MSSTNVHQFYHWWIGLLATKLYERFGNDVLPVIHEASTEVGKVIGHRVRSKMANTEWNTIAETTVKHLKKVYGDLDIELTLLEQNDTRVRFTEKSCPFQLAHGHGPICDALMGIDEARFEIISDGKAEYQTLKHSSSGPLSCEWVIKRKSK
jgi:predicted hydrocarbon binding protein